MTNAEFEELYGDVEVTFSSYYKYSFTFVGVAPDGTAIAVTYGGCGDDIYRYEVCNNQKCKVGSVSEWNYIAASKDGAEVFSYYDY